jgi:small subunit ribosomal protein S3
MGQKVNPVGLRIGINKKWKSRWFATRDYARLLREDMLIRDIIEEQLGNSAAISRIEMERTAEEVKVDMYTAKPGMVIGRRGATINDIRQTIEKATGNIIQLNIVEVKKPELVAILVAENVANQLLGRVSFRRAMKKAISLSLKSGAKGVKIQCSGRLGGAEMARTEWYREGRVPLHTLRANIDFGFAEANTTFGKIGVKVWIYLGDVILDEPEEDRKTGQRPEPRRREKPKAPGDKLKARVKKGAKKIKEIRKTVISAGLKAEEDAKNAEQEKAKEEKEMPAGTEKKAEENKEAKVIKEDKPDKEKAEEKPAKEQDGSGKVSAGPDKEKAKEKAEDKGRDIKEDSHKDKSNKDSK